MKKIQKKEPARVLISLDLNQNTSQEAQKVSILPVKTKQVSPTRRRTPKFMTNGSRDNFASLHDKSIRRLGSNQKIVRQASRNLLQTLETLQTLQIQHTIIRKQDKVEVYKYLNQTVSENRQESTHQRLVNPLSFSIKKDSHRFKQINRLQAKNIQISEFNHSKVLKTQPNQPIPSYKFQKITIKNCTPQRPTSISLNKTLNKSLHHSQNSKKCQQFIQKLRKYKFIEQYLSDLDLIGILNELQISGVQQCRWVIIIIDRVYKIMKKHDNNDYTQKFIRRV